VLLARALVKNPPLLILDEPAQGLDEEQSALFKSIIEQICEHSNKTLIYVTHLKTEIPICVSKFIQLEKGRIVSNNEEQKS
jgi:molybdate transport system ATP-binding protein